MAKQLKKIIDSYYPQKNRRW